MLEQNEHNLCFNIFTDFEQFFAHWVIDVPGWIDVPGFEQVSVNHMFYL